MTLTLAATESSRVMLDLLFILAAAATVSLICRRLKIAAIAGYLIAGAVFGPNALGLITDSESIDNISQIAIILLMFGIGLHLDRSDLKAGLAPILAIGALSTILTTAIGTPIAKLFGMHWPAALTVATAVAMSSTAVVLRMLQQRRELRQAHGRISFGTLIVQDMGVVIILAGMPVVAGWAQAAQGVEVASTEEVMNVGALVAKAAITIGVMALVIVAGITLLPKLLAEAARDSTNELLLVLSAALGLGTAVLTAYLDLSPELGAFLAGFLLAGTPFRFQLSGMIGPMRDLFMAVFFTAVGLQLNFGAIGGVWWVILIAFVLVMMLKMLTIGGSAWLLGAPPAVAVTTGVTLAQAGEFTLVILGFATAAGIFNGLEIVPSAMIAVVFISLLTTPPLMNISRRLGMLAVGWPQAPWFKRGTFARNSQDSAPDGDYRVVIAGFGPVGRALSERFAARGVRVSVIELNRKTVEKQTGLGRHIVYGDATNPEVLESAGVSIADAVVLTIPDDDAMLRACRVIRNMNKTAFIAARTNYLSKAFLAKELGANHVTVEELATAEAMAEQVLSCFDLAKQPVSTPARDSSVSPASS
ncbi:MAG: cation:proton antiporter [Planctomycetota bacterium]